MKHIVSTAVIAKFNCCCEQPKLEPMNVQPSKKGTYFYKRWFIEYAEKYDITELVYYSKARSAIGFSDKGGCIHNPKGVVWLTVHSDS